MRSDNGAGIHHIEIKKNTQMNRTMRMANTSSILNLIETFCVRVDTTTFAFRSVRILLFMRVFFNAYFIIYSTNHVEWTRQTPKNVCATLNDSLGLVLSLSRCRVIGCKLFRVAKQFKIYRALHIVDDNNNKYFTSPNGTNVRIVENLLSSLGGKISD